MAAEIIPFPRQQPLTNPPTGNARLLQALDGLQAALAEQRTAIAAWRESLTTLQTTMRGVGDGLQRYRGTLDRLHGDVTALNGQAVQLGQWADSIRAAAPESA